MDPTILFAGKHLTLKAIGHWEYAERTKASGAVVILPITDDDELLLIEQFRPPLQRRVIELPAGLVGDTADYEGEPFLQAAQRELFEETGYEAKTWKRLFSGPSSAGLTTEAMTFFLAAGLTFIKVAEGDGHENIELHKVKRSELIPWLQSRESQDRIVDYKIYAALFFFEKSC